MQDDRYLGSFFGPEHFVEMLMLRARRQGDQRALVYLADGERDEVSITYAELDRQARAIAARLGEMGLAGERALLMYPSGLEFVAALFGCLYAAVVPVPLSAPLRRRGLSRLRAVVQDADASVALTTSEIHQRIAGDLADEPALSEIPWLTTDTVDEAEADRYAAPSIDVTTPALLQYTSGSTDTPRGVLLNHGNLIHNSALIYHCFEHSRASSGVFWLPSFHDMGLVGGILQPIYGGRLNVLMSPMAFLQKPLRWLAAISRYGATGSGGPNFAYDLCVQKTTPQQRAALDLSKWRVAFNGAEPVREETMDRFAEAFAPSGFRREAFYPCYGLAEATLMVSGGMVSEPPVIAHFDASAIEAHRVIAADAGADGSRSLVSCGPAAPDTTVAIVDPHTLRAAEANAVGEVWIKGPSVAAGGYWRKTKQSRDVFEGHIKGSDVSYLRSGDLGFLHDGQLFITGRLRDLIILRGRNYYPQDIERTAASAHKALHAESVAAFAVDVSDESKAVLVCEVDRGHDDYKAIIADIRRAVLDVHDVGIGAIDLIRPGGLPRTTSGKIQRFACCRQFVDQSYKVLSSWRSWNDSSTVIAGAEPRVQSHATGDTTNANSEKERATDTSSSVGVVRLPRDRIERAVVDQVRFMAPDHSGTLSMKTSVLDLGLDSLQRLDLLANIEGQLGGRFSQHVIADLLTLSDIVEAAQGGLLPIGNESLLEGDAQGAGSCRVEHFAEYQAMRQRIAQLQAQGGENPYFRKFDHLTSNTAVVNGRTIHNFSLCDYLGLMHHPAVVATVHHAIDTVGHALPSSRLVCANVPLVCELERELAEFLGTEASLVFPNGYAANVTVLGHMLGPRDLFLYDELSHNSIVQGAIMSGATRRKFPHKDWQFIDNLLADRRHAYRRVLIAMDGLYSMDGDWPDLKHFVALRAKHNVMVMVDDAHGIGAMGETGRGVAEACGIKRNDVDMWMGSLGKALGAGGGGFYAGSAALIEYLKYSTPGFIYTVGCAPPVLAAAREGLRIVQREPQRLVQLRQRSALFIDHAQMRGLNVGNASGSPIVPVIIGDTRKTLQLSQAMLEQGINVQPMLPPAVPEDGARLRFFITCEHTETQITEAIDTLANLLEKVNGRTPLASRSTRS